MSTYVDIDTSAEAIQEDKELIEAVNQIVEKTAEIIYADVKNDVSGFYLQLRRTAEALFPFLAYWREDNALFWEDMYKLSISGVLFVVAFFILSPSQPWVKKSTSWLSLGNKTVKNTQYNHRTTSSDKGDETSVEFSERLQRSRSFSSIDYSMTHNEIEEEEEETEEEKFSKKWPSIISEARYRNLVLPPECKRVEKPRRYIIPALTEEKKDDDDMKNDDDKPFDRLVIYWRQFLHFVMSMMRYDYAGAGWTLFHWLESCIKVRNNMKTPSDEDEIDDDESDAGSVAGSVLGRLSSPSATQARSAPSSTRFPSPRGRMRSKRDSLMKWQSTEKSEETKADADPGESNDSIEKAHICLTAEPSMLEEYEGKKDWLNKQNRDAASKSDEFASTLTPPLTPPSTPTSRKDLLTPPSTPIGLSQSHRRDSFSSIYATPPRDHSDLVGSGEVFETKLAALNTRFSGKSKDALETYRSSSTRKVPALETRPNENVSSLSLGSGGFLPHSGAVMERKESEDHTFYFEAASTDESIRKMAVDVPVPDRNGYILGDDFLMDNECTPLLVFVNSRSGPQQGHILISQLRGLLNPIQVWDLADGGPEDILKSFSAFTRLRILVCGGDGTVSWIVSTIEKMNLQRWPPIAILPLGTGNDLARVHGWGGGYSNESLIDILEQVAESYISWLDRWELTVENKKGKVKEVKSFFNYFGVGADAQMALQVHKVRALQLSWFYLIDQRFNKSCFTCVAPRAQTKPVFL
jgi:hypothetical protein